MARKGMYLLHQHVSNSLTFIHTTDSQNEISSTKYPGFPTGSENMGGFQNLMGGGGGGLSQYMWGAWGA